MKLPTRETIRYHATRWVWVPFLALVAHVSFPSGAADVAPLLEPGARSDKEIVAPFNFVVNKSEDELQREAEELAASAKPIYEFRQRAYDSTATMRSEEHTSELQSQSNLVCRLLLEKKKKTTQHIIAYAACG